MPTQPVFVKKPTTYSSGNEYMDIVDELLRKNRGSRNLTLYDTGSNTPNVLPEAAGVKPASIFAGTNVGKEYGDTSYIPSAIQSTRTAQNQVPQTANISNTERRETYQEAVDKALRISQERHNQGIDEDQAFNQYIEQNGTVNPTGPSEQDYINYFLDSRQVTDPTSRNILSVLLSLPSKEETAQIQKYEIPDIKRDIELSQARTDNTNYMNQYINETDPTKKAQLYKLWAAATAKLGSEAPGSVKGKTDYYWMDQKDKEKADEIAHQALLELNKPDQQVNPVSSVRQFLGNAVDVLGSSLGLGEGNISEQIAGGPTINTGRKVRKNIGDFIPSMPSLVRNVQAAEIGNNMKSLNDPRGDYSEPKPLTVQTKLQPIEPRVDNIQRGNSGAPGLWNEITGRYNPQYPRPLLSQSILQKQPIQPFAEYLKSIGFQNYLYGGNSSNPQKSATKPPQQNIFADIGKGIQDVGSNALAEAGRGVEGLKSGLTNFMDENIFKKQNLSKMGAKNAVGEDSAQTAMEGMPGFAKSTPYSNNQDAFFKAGGAEQYKDYLAPGVNKNYRGSLSTSLFNDKFFENPDNVANVFGSTSQGGQATDKYRSYMQKQYPIIPGHDSPTVKKVATGKYDDGSEWRVEYDDVDPVYYDNQYNKQVLASIPSVLTSPFKYTAPRTGGKQSAGSVPSGVFEPVKGDKTIPGTKGFTVPAQASNIRTQSFPAGTSNVFSVAAQQKPYTPASSGYSIPKKSSTPSSSGYKAPQQNRPSAPSQSRPSAPQQSRPNPTPAPAPSRPSTPSYSAPQQSRPNLWSNPAPSYARPSPAPQQSRPAPKPQNSNVFSKLVNTIKSWFW